MKKIIRFRPLEWSDLQYAKIIKPFEDMGLVEDFVQTDAEIVELVCDVTKDYNQNHYNFDHLLYRSKLKESPSTLFEALRENNDRLPTLWAYTLDQNGRRRNIHAIKNHYMLQSMAQSLDITNESVGEYRKL